VTTEPTDPISGEENGSQGLDLPNILSRLEGWLATLSAKEANRPAEVLVKERVLTEDEFQSMTTLLSDGGYISDAKAFASIALKYVVDFIKGLLPESQAEHA
jgi:hypothetical protein